MRIGNESLFFWFSPYFSPLLPPQFFLADTVMAPIQGSPKVDGQYVE